MQALRPQLHFDRTCHSASTSHDPLPSASLCQTRTCGAELQQQQTYSTDVQRQPARLPFWGLLMSQAACQAAAAAREPAGHVVEAGQEDARRAAKLLASGGLAGAISRTITAPIDRLKFMMQASSATRLTLSQGLARIASEKTVKAYFRGNGTNVIKNVPETALKLTLNDRVKSLVCRDGHRITLWERLMIGGLSGGIAQACIYPLEVIQARLATTHGVYTGMQDVAQRLIAREGYLAFYRGLTPCLLGIIPYAGLDITIFEVTKERIRDYHNAPPPPQHLLLAGMASSSFAQTVAYPWGLIRNRLAIDGQAGQERLYRGMLDCFAKTYSAEGLAGFYKGWSMSLAKVAPAAGISWFVFEETKIFLHCPDVRT